MNLDYVLFNLKEAQKELDKTITEMETNKTYGQGEFVVGMSHLYHHLTTAWNSRRATAKECEECSDKNFKKWRKFPSNEELLLVE